MAEPIISVSGLRGIVGSELTPIVAAQYVAAFCTTLPPGPVVLSRDGRASGRMFASIVGATLQAHGHEVLDAGIASTPTVGVLVRTERAVGGIQISASHNPVEYNGLKLFGAEGRVIPQKAGELVKQAYVEKKAGWKGVGSIGPSAKVIDPHSAHEELVLAIVNPYRIAPRRFRVLLDSNRGAGSLLGSRLLDRLGCHVQLVGEIPDGKFMHPPEPIAENLQGIAQQVREGGFQVGFCQDPDADRLAIIDEKGNYIGEEYTVALCLMQILSQSRGPIVTNCATSSMSKVLAEKHGVPFHLSSVGEANVCEKMIAEKALFGGEGNGGPIDPRVGYVRDSFVGMALILDLMATTGKSISKLVAEIPFFAMLKTKVTLAAEKLPATLDMLASAMKPDRISRQDGLRMDWSDRWLLVRGSNTEPIVRLIAEAPSLAGSEALCQQAKKLIEQHLAK